MTYARLLGYPAVAMALAAGAATATAQTFVQCESREYQYQFCAIPQGATRVTLVEQRSRSACIEGRSWGWDRRGIWVSNGCEGVFDIAVYAPPPPVSPPLGAPGGEVITCESRNYQQQFCGTGNIVGAMLVQQRSRAPCIEGQSWGFRPDGIWVSGGCEVDFRIRRGHYVPAPLPAPTRPGLFVCESRDYQYAVCPTGRIAGAQLVRQISQAACIEGSTWGTLRDGIWVDRGCEGEFEIYSR